MSGPELLEDEPEEEPADTTNEEEEVEEPDTPEDGEEDTMPESDTPEEEVEEQEEDDEVAEAETPDDAQDIEGDIDPEDGASGGALSAIPTKAIIVIAAVAVGVVILLWFLRDDHATQPATEEEIRETEQQMGVDPNASPLEQDAQTMEQLGMGADHQE